MPLASTCNYISWVINNLLFLVVLNSLVQVFAIKNLTQLGVKLNPLVMIKQLNFRVVHLQVVNLLVDFILEFSGLFFFNLAFFKHILDKVVLMDKQVVLRASVLDSFCNFREHLFNVVLHECLS
jgi:hypothetical protein